MDRSTIAVQVEHLRNLEDGWDSYGGVPPNPVALAKAEELASILVAAGWPVPALVPCGDGGVQVEWHTFGFDIEALIEAVS